MSEDNKKIIFSKTVALLLVNRGFLVININTDKKNGRPIYLFDNTEEFSKAFSEIMISRQAIQVRLMREEIELIVKSLASQSVVNTMDNNKAENEKINILIQSLTCISKTNMKLTESEDV